MTPTGSYLILYGSAPKVGTTSVLEALKRLEDAVKSNPGPPPIQDGAPSKTTVNEEDFIYGKLPVCELSCSSDMVIFVFSNNVTRLFEHVMENGSIPKDSAIFPCEAAETACVFSLTNRDSFTALIANFKDMWPDIIIGNMQDKVSERVVTKEEAEAFAFYVSRKYFEVSAVSGAGLKPLFRHGQHLIRRRYNAQVEAYIESTQMMGRAVTYSGAPAGH